MQISEEEEKAAAQQVFFLLLSFLLLIRMAMYGRRARAQQQQRRKRERETFWPFNNLSLSLCVCVCCFLNFLLWKEDPLLNGHAIAREKKNYPSGAIGQEREREREKRRRCVCTSSGVLARRLEEVHIKLGDPIVVLSWPTRLRHTIEQNAGTRENNTLDTDSSSCCLVCFFVVVALG